MCIVCVEATPEIFLCHERLQHCVPDIFGKDTNQAVKFLELLRLRKTSSKLEDGLTTRFLGDVAQEQAVVATIFQIRRERPGCASAQLEFQAKIANNFLREQADQVRVARQICIVVRENFLRGGGSADVVIFLQHQDTQTGPREISRGHETIVSGTEDNHVVFSFHCNSCVMESASEVIFIWSHPLEGQCNALANTDAKTH